MESNTERKNDKRAKPVTQFLALVSELLSIENKEDIRERRIPRLPNKVKIEFLNVTGIICGNPARYFPAILVRRSRVTGVVRSHANGSIPSE